MTDTPAAQGDGFKPFDINSVDGLERDDLHTIEADLDLFAHLAAWASLGYTAFHIRTSETSITVPMSALTFDLGNQQLRILVAHIEAVGQRIYWEHDLLSVDEIGPLYFTVLDEPNGEIIHLTATNDIEDPALDVDHGLDEIGRAIAEHERLINEKLGRL